MSTSATNGHMNRPTDGIHLGIHQWAGAHLNGDSVVLRFFVLSRFRFLFIICHYIDPLLRLSVMYKGSYKAYGIVYLEITPSP